MIMPQCRKGARQEGERRNFLDIIWRRGQNPHHSKKQSHEAHLVVHPVQQARHNREDGGTQRLHVIRQQADIALEEANSSSVAIHYRLRERKTTKSDLFAFNPWRRASLLRTEMPPPIFRSPVWQQW